jgi:uncharacterized protein (DUF2147 family)
MRWFQYASIFFIGLCFSAVGAAADEMSPVGRWRAVSDKTGNVTGIIEITAVGDSLQGKIVKSIPDPDDDPPDTICTKCDGPDKNKPILGLTIMKGFHKDGDSWDDGTILDPRSGDVYSAEMHVGENGKKLFLRGYLGISLLGRTETWLRAE